MESTHEQIKKLWGECGASVIPLIPSSHLNSTFKVLLSDKRALFVDILAQTIDLNNLFKYAVPKVLQHMITIIFENMSLTQARLALFRAWNKNIEKGMSYEDALFQVIYRLMEVK